MFTAGSRKLHYGMANKVRYEERLKTGMCTHCGTVPAFNGARCEKHTLVNRISRRKRRLRDRDKILTAYGSRCNCCGETESLFLTVDHVNNDGAQHRRDIGGSSQLYSWIIKNNYPDTFQILCQNCNTGKYRNNGICPHKFVEQGSSNKSLTSGLVISRPADPSEITQGGGSFL